MTIQKRLLGFGAFTASLLLAGSAVAGTVTLTYYPNSDADGNTAGNTTTSAPGYGTSSWQANDTTTGGKSEFYVAATVLFPADTVTIDDIASISYWTNKPGTSGAPDWGLNIYTAPEGSGNEASWYHTRLNSEPYFTNTSSANDVSNTWHQWSTGNATNPMLFYDVGRDGGLYGTYADPTLAELQAGSINWPSGQSGVNYGLDVVNLFSLQTGSAWADGFTGLVDGLTITLTNGDQANVNLEATPEPSTWLLLLTGLAGVAFFVRRRQTA